MSEYINNSSQRKALLKHMIQELHQGEAPEMVKSRVKELLKNIPYNEVVEVEQELISEGLPEEEVLKFCDIHSSVLEGSITSHHAEMPAAHPVDTLKKENREVEKVTKKVKDIFDSIPAVSNGADDEIAALTLKLKGLFNSLYDLDKHYKRKEYLLFPFLEKVAITGPPKVMWGKHDEIREQLKASIEALEPGSITTKEELMSVVVLLLGPAVEAVESMIMKEEEILIPMCLEKFSEENWYQIYLETPVYGYCLYDTRDEWKPGDSVVENLKKSQQEEGGPAVSGVSYSDGAPIRLSSGSFDMKELEALFVTIPIDITYVDANDKVKFFSHSPNRVFERNRSIIGRDVRLCHPPGSVNIVEQILVDFKSGKENQAKFWLSNFMGRFVYIEYTVLRGKDNEYLGVIEVTQDITEFRKLQGDQRLLSYTTK
ncbi:MAG: hemerythrin [Bacteroidetes bacterium GWE2_39_28]|nr:MAG: hemerythrin [Bacteroidetes bacterium GWE2_39_28]OFY12675.1 MAG: hemerythrin [Bacteroidetes bacterium GWF2_39_10]HCT94610.1 DUF438 domain-containing protein [Rikenellaceae bacterium]